MQKLLRKSLYVPFFLILAAPLAAYAQDSTQVMTIVQGTFNVLQVVVMLAFTACVIMFGYGIFKLIAAAGDPGAVQKAKGILLWGVVGMAVLASIFGLIQFLQRYFGVGAASGTIVPPNISASGANTSGASTSGASSNSSTASQPPPPPPPPPP